MKADNITNALPDSPEDFHQPKTCTCDVWGHPIPRPDHARPCPGCRRQTRTPSETPALATN